MPPGGNLLRGPAPEIADDSVEPSPATPTAPFNRVWIPGEKTSILQRLLRRHLSAGALVGGAGLGLASSAPP